MEMMYRRFQALVGWLFIIIGLVVLPMPIPLGAIMIVVGIALVAPTSPGMRNVLRRVRRRFPSFDRQLERWLPKFPKFIQDLIISTRPGDEEEPNGSHSSRD